MKFILSSYKVKIVLIFLSVHYVPVVSGTIQGIITHANTKESSTDFNPSLLGTQDVVALLSALNKPHSLNLRILYDLPYEDFANEVLQSTKSLITTGRMMYQYDGEYATLQQIITSLTRGTSPVVLIIFCSIQHIEDIFQKIQSNRLKSHLVDWLLIQDESTISSHTNSIQRLQGFIHEGTRVALVVKDPNVITRFSLYSSQVNDEGRVRLSYMGTWNRAPGDGKGWRPQSPLYDLLFTGNVDLYRDMRGRRMLVGVNDIEGFFGTEPSSSEDDEQPLRLLGIDGTIIRTLGEVLNFNGIIRRPPDGLWGNPLPNGTIPGIIGMTARREVGFSISAISITGVREAIIDYTFPYIIEPFNLFSRAPKEKNRVLAVLSPFTFEVWLALIVATLTIGPVLKLQSMMSGLLLEEKPQDTLQLFSFNAFRTLVIQGNRIQPIRWSQRALFFSWYLFCLVVSALYSGMLTAVLLIPAFETPINSLTDLPRAVKEGFVLGVLKDSSNEYIFRAQKMTHVSRNMSANKDCKGKGMLYHGLRYIAALCPSTTEKTLSREATSGIFKETWELFDQNNPDTFVVRPEIGVQRAAEKKYVYFGFKFSSEIVVSKVGRIKYHIGTESIYPHGIAIICPEGVPYKKIFDDMLLRMVEGGLIPKWRKNEFLKAAKIGSKGDSGSKNTAITLAHLQAAFFVIFLGCLMGGVALTLECITAYVDSYKETRHR